MHIELLTDVVVHDAGTVVSFSRVSQEAWDWFEENVHWEPWQEMGPTIHVDHRPAQLLVDALHEAGLRVQPSGRPFVAGRA